jgi:hypothetical protein
MNIDVHSNLFETISKNPKISYLYIEERRKKQSKSHLKITFILKELNLFTVKNRDTFSQILSGDRLVVFNKIDGRPRREIRISEKWMNKKDKNVRYSFKLSYLHARLPFKCEREYIKMFTKEEYTSVVEACNKEHYYDFPQSFCVIL